MKFSLRILLIIGVLFASACASRKSGSASQGSITQEELVRRTQELNDSVAGGDQGLGRSTLPTTACTLMRRDGI